MSETESVSPSWRAKIEAWPRRHPYLTALLVVVVLIRVALPYVLRPILEDQISAVLNGHVEIEDVDLALLRGEAAVEGVRVHETGGGEPPVAFAKFLANIGWTSFPFSQVVVEEIHLLRPVVRVVREADGSINLERLPAAEESAGDTNGEQAGSDAEPSAGSGDAAEAGDEPSDDVGASGAGDEAVVAADSQEAEVDESDAENGWPIGLTRLALQDATLSFEDRSVEGAKPIEFHIDLLEIERTAYGGPIYDAQGKITLQSKLAGAPLQIVADFESEVTKATSLGNFSVNGLNVGLGAPYAAQLLGWRDLQGKLDVDFDFAANEGKTRSPRVVLDLHDFMIAVEGDEQPALTWDSLRIEIASADLHENFFDVALIRLTNFMTRVKPAEPQPLVVLSKMEPAAAEQEPEEAPEAESGDAGLDAGSEGEVAAGDQEPAEPNDEAAAAEAEDEQAADPAGAAGPRWRLASLEIVDAKIAVEAPKKNLDVGIQVTMKELSSELGAKGALDFQALIEGGSLAVTGALGVVPPHFDGKIGLKDFALASVLPVVPDPTVEIVRDGVARADLALVVDVLDGSAGEAAEAAPVNATLSGDLGLAGLSVTADNSEKFDFRWEDLAIAIDGIDVRHGVPATDDGKAPIRIARIDLVAPVFQGMRLEDGELALPEQLGGETQHVADGQVAEEVAHEIAEGESSEDSSMPAMHLGKLRLTKGAVRITDRSVTPVVKPGMSKMKLSVDDVRMPERSIGKLAFAGTGLRGGLISANGSVAGEATDVVFKIEKYKLRPYDPYAVTFSGYGIRSGALTVESEVRLKGAEFDTQTNVVVHRLGMKATDGETGFEEEIGIPLSLALALLKDTDQNIVLDVPVKGDAETTEIGLGAIIGQQLKRILINALASPLKLFGGGNDLSDFGAAQIGFAEGGGTLSPEGRDAANQLGTLLRERPDLAIHLDVKNSLADVRALQEGVLLDELRARESVQGDSLAIKTFLEAKAIGEVAELPPHLEPLLDDLLSHRRPPAEKIETLSTSRIAVVRTVMLDELEVRPEQIVVEEKLDGGFIDGSPVVEAELGVVEEDEEDPEEEDPFDD